jgi:effector-binding domain-containing protein
VWEPLSGPLPEHGVVQVHELPAVEQMASTVYHVSFDTLGEAYSALLKWIESSGYRICVPERE